MTCRSAAAMRKVYDFSEGTTTVMEYACGTGTVKITHYWGKFTRYISALMTSISRSDLKGTEPLLQNDCRG